MSKELDKAPVEQAGGDERDSQAEGAQGERRITISKESCGTKVILSSGTFTVEEVNSAVQEQRAALAQPSPKSGYYSDQEWINAGCPPEQPSPVQAEQAEVERLEVVARVVHSNPVVLDQCAPLNANDEMMTVAQHAASVARWAEMFNRVEQERDAALARVASLESKLAELELELKDMIKERDRLMCEKVDLLEALGPFLGHELGSRP